MELNSYFETFLERIRPDQDIKDELKEAHRELRDRLAEFEGTRDFVVATFLQGSYRRFTAIKPTGKSRADVDVVVVTNFDKDKTKPKDALAAFKSFLDEYYKAQWRYQGRSIGISLENVDLDLVVTAAPSLVGQRLAKSMASYDLEGLDFESYFELNKAAGTASLSEPWKNEPLYIPDREAEDWKATDPIAQLEWTREKNANCNGHYVNVVKAIKWARRHRKPNGTPKGYPVEHIIGVTCPDGITSVAEGVTRTLEAIVSTYVFYVALNTKPKLEDHGATQHDVWLRVTAEEFKSFYEDTQEAAQLARAAYDMPEGQKPACVAKWIELFGSEFPSYAGSSGGKETADYTRRDRTSDPADERFA